MWKDIWPSISQPKNSKKTNNHGYGNTGHKKKRKHKEVIRRSMFYITENISELEKITRKLVSERVLSFEEREQIFAKVTMPEKCQCLMEMFYRKDELAFEKFKNALLLSNQDVVEELRNREREIEDEELKKASQREGSVGLKGQTVQPGGSSSAESSAYAREEEKIERRKEKKKARKKKLIRKMKEKKMFSIYGPSDNESDSDTESSSSEEDDDEIDSKYDEIDALVDLFYSIQEYVKKMNYYSDMEFKVNRFDDENPDDKSLLSANAKKRYFGFGVKSQKFRVNRAIYISRVGFFGCSSAPITSYTIKLQLIKCGKTEGQKVTPNDEMAIIGETHQVVEVEQAKIVFIPFRFPIGIEPHIWYKLRFKINGLDEILVELPKAKLSEAPVSCERHGPVRFEFSTNWYNSTCQMPIIGFFKAKPRLITTIFPSTTEQKVQFHNQDETRAWEDREKSNTFWSTYL